MCKSHGMKVGLIDLIRWLFPVTNLQPSFLASFNWSCVTLGIHALSAVTKMEGKVNLGVASRGKDLELEVLEVVKVQVVEPFMVRAVIIKEA